MTIGGALSDLNNLLNADDIPCYYKPSIKAVIDTIALEQESRTGHWVTKPHVYGATYCSECDFELKIDDTNYCPNCGSYNGGDDNNKA